MIMRRIPNGLRFIPIGRGVDKQEREEYDYLIELVNTPEGKKQIEHILDLNNDILITLRGK